MVIEEVKKEATSKRPSALSLWYRLNLGRDVAISDIDWLITSISNKNIENRYLILEEKIISNSEKLLIGLGQARSLKEVTQDIIKNNVPVFVIFILNQNISNGVWLYEFNSTEIDNKSNWIKLENSWYVNVKKYANFFTEIELRDKLLNIVGSKLLK